MAFYPLLALLMAFMSLSLVVCVRGCGRQDIQSCVEPGHAGGNAGVVGAALLFEVFGDAMAMARGLVCHTSLDNGRWF